MWCSHWRRIGSLFLLVAVVVSLAQAPGVLAAGGRGDGTGSSPTGPQFGNGGGGGTGCGDPDEFGIYSRPAPSDGKIEGTLRGSNAEARSSEPRRAADARVRWVLLLQRWLLGVTG